MEPIFQYNPYISSDLHPLTGYPLVSGSGLGYDEEGILNWDEEVRYGDYPEMYTHKTPNIQAVPNIGQLSRAVTQAVPPRRFDFSTDLPLSDQSFIKGEEPALAAPVSMSTTSTLSLQKPKVHLIADKVKTRAETQIKLQLVLDPLSPEYKRIRFPQKTLAKPKLFASEQEKAEYEKDGGILYMDISLVLATAIQKDEQKARVLKRARNGTIPKRCPDTPLTELDKTDDSHPLNGGEVVICTGCKEREEKRYNRKKKREDEGEWERYKNERVILINEKEYKSLREVDHLRSAETQFTNHAKQVEFAMRIACYCRHQEEKSPLGYQVIFTFKDGEGNLVTQHISEIFQITDDHKNKDSLHENTMAWAPAVSVGQAYAGSAHYTTQVTPSLLAGYPINALSPPATYTQSPTTIAAAAAAAYSQPTTPAVPNFQQAPVSPLHSQFPQNATPTTPLRPEFNQNFAPIQRSQSLLDTAAFYQNFQPGVSLGGPIHRVNSLDTFDFQQLQQQMQQQMQLQLRYQDYASAPQSCSTTPITQSRPASPTWEQGVPSKRNCLQFKSV